MLKGKVAVVTGAAMGIGQATTELLLQKGAKVALLDVNETAGNSAKEALDEEHGAESTLFLQCNVESDKDVKDAFRATVETFGGIDIVCNNAGILNEDNWEKALSTNLAGVIRVGFVALEHMNKLTGGRGGVIVNTASLAAPVFPVYSATKHGVVGFTRSMAAASVVLGYGIRFNALCPAIFSTLYHLVEMTVLGLFRFSASEVAEGALELLTDETKNGEALILKHDEKKYMTFPSP
uniref:15-hydroxyprostaglandin dehydrogenase [NAD(+)] n=1 Tax=Salarias fasciatus TaxID=181472 RepID=A0A672GZT0_SALFA